MANPPPANPYLADSAYPIAHGTCAQQDATPLAGPVGPGRRLGVGDLDYAFLGPMQMGLAISGPYPDGRRVIWNNGSERITKLDEETFEVLASYEIPGRPQTPEAEIETALGRLDTETGPDAIAQAMDLAVRFLMGLSGVYFVLDRDNTLFLGHPDHLVAYGDADPNDPASPIVERGRWDRPAEVTGGFVGCNITSDGWLVMSTDTGWVVCLSRSLDDHRAIRLRGAEGAEAHTEAMAAERGNRGFGWVRTSLCTDDAGGIYVSSLDHTHKVIWRNHELSIDEADGAWMAPYRNGAGLGSGTTPCLMGFGADEDRLVVIGDGDDVVNITLFWRDEIPDDWEQLPDAPCRRIAAMGRADLGDPSRTALQTEQSITVSGYGAMTVDNEPASIPDGFPERGRRLLVFWLGHHPEYTPHGLHKFTWDPATRAFDTAWVCDAVASCNSVPYVSEAADLVYTVGARNHEWTLEAVRWSTGEPVFHHILGPSRHNSLGAGVTIDEDGRILHGTAFGKLRIANP